MRVLKGMVGDVGTLLGPTYDGEWMIVRELLPEGLKLGYAYPQELQEITIALATGERDPQSLAEIKLKRSLGVG